MPSKIKYQSMNSMEFSPKVLNRAKQKPNWRQRDYNDYTNYMNDDMAEVK